MLKTSAAELERLERKRRKNPDPGFSGEREGGGGEKERCYTVTCSYVIHTSDYAQAQFRQYDRLTKQLKPDMEEYEKQKIEL